MKEVRRVAESRRVSSWRHVQPEPRDTRESGLAPPKQLDRPDRSDALRARSRNLRTVVGSDRRRIIFQVCCIPFFTYGIALGDLIEVDRDSRVASIVHRSGRRVIRVACKGRAEAQIHHEWLHDLLVSSGVLHEFSSSGYVSIDIENEGQADALVSTLQPRVETALIMWEWGSD